MHNGLKENK